MSHRGLLLVNLGTPKSFELEDVGGYLREFLMDPNVIDVPNPIRWLLVHALIVPKRQESSANAYREIWTDEGSPLLVESEKLTRKVKAHRHDLQVELGMRYGLPGIEDALVKFREAGVQDLYVLPLYPQYAQSSTQTALDYVGELLQKLKWHPQVWHRSSFYQNAMYIQTLANNYKATTRDWQPDFTLISYHGLPKRHLKRLNKNCLTEGCCDEKSDRSPTCYRYQCFQTSRELVAKLGLQDGTWQSGFQSRLGPGWIEPFTDVELESLPKRGVKRLAVLSPSFVVDCLETLEEISVRGQEVFTKAGGEELRLVPSLNSEDMWAKSLGDSVDERALWQMGLKPTGR